MSVLLVTYDLNSPGQKHQKVLDQIKTHDYVKLSESSYAINTNKSTKALYEEFEQNIDDNDRLYIIPMMQEWWGFGLKSTNQWLTKNLPNCRC